MATTTIGDCGDVGWQWWLVVIAGGDFAAMVNDGFGVFSDSCGDWQ